MILKALMPASLRWLLAFAALLLLGAEAFAAVKVERARISSGFSMRVIRYSWGQFSCLIENSDPAEHKVTIRLLAIEGSQTNFLSESVNVPAKTALSYHAPVLVENSERYTLEIFVDGRKLPSSRDNEMIIKLLTNKSLLVGMLNDDEDGGVGAFVQLPLFKDKVFSSSFTAGNAPESWVQYKDLAALIIHRPNYKLYTSRQIRAVLDYVAQGGTALFTDPKGEMEALSSPFAELLPLTPCRIRQIDSLPALSAVSPSFKNFNGRTVDFLESSPSEDGFDLLNDGKFSVLRCKRYGLGTVRMSAIPITDEAFKGDNQSWEMLLDLALSKQREFPSYAPASASLDQMTGFKVPGLGAVRTIVIVYLGVLGAIIIAGVRFKRTGWSWVAAAVFSVAMTFIILERAKTASDKKGRLLTSIQVLNATPGASSAQGFHSFFSDANFDADATASGENGLLCGMLPNLNSFLPPGMAMGAISDDGEKKIGSGRKTSQANPMQFARPIEIRRDIAGRPGLQSLNVSANTSRQFMTYEGCLPSVPLDKLPSVSAGPDGFALEPWKPSPGLRFEKAFLMLPNGALPLEYDGSTVKMSSSGPAIFQSDLITKGIKEALEGACGRQSPYIALIGHGGSQVLSFNGSPAVQGRTVVQIPAGISCQGRKLSVPKEAILLQAGDSSTRMAMDGNRVKPDYEAQGTCSLTLLFTMPSFLPKVDPEEIVVSFSYADGGNIKAVPALVGKAPPPPPPPPAKPGKDGKIKAPPAPKPPPPVIIKGVERGGDFVFSGPAVKEVIDACSNSGVLQIEAFERNPRMPESQKMRANRWSPLSVSVSVKGSVPAGSVPFKY